MKRNKIYKNYLKRLFDFIVALITIILLSPLFLILALIVKINLGSPVLFKQSRPGLNEKLFTLYKFRSMTNEFDKNGEKLSDEKRLTKLGRILRSTSLDELPELFNILKGDMSIVGPRPLMPEYLNYYNKEERKRHTVRPGLTGLAQINGRSFITWEEIFIYDLKYVDDITFFQDLKIIFSTIKSVFMRKNIADMSEAKKTKDGDIYFDINGEKVFLHKPLHIERKDVNND